MSELSKQIDILEEESQRWWAILHKAECLNLEISGIGLDSMEKLLQELADRRKADAEHDALLDSLKDEADVYAAQEKCATYDERDMQKAKYTVGSAVLDREFLFHQLRTCLNELGLVSISATDQTAFIAIRDILHAHAQDKSYDARYGVKTATNASKEQGRAYERPSDKV